MTCDNQAGKSATSNGNAQNGNSDQRASTSTDHDKFKFKCKECEFIANSCKAANDHHKDQHGKCYCPTCGKACNTPSTLACHVYSHKEDLPFPYADCDKKFAFEGQLKQHHFKHRTIAVFPCSKCDKRYMHEGELVKNLKVHDNKKYTCKKCKYFTNDPRNLKQHEKLHTVFPICVMNFSISESRKNVITVVD